MPAALGCYRAVLRAKNSGVGGTGTKNSSLSPLCALGGEKGKSCPPTPRRNAKEGRWSAAGPLSQALALNVHAPNLEMPSISMMSLFPIRMSSRDWPEGDWDLQAETLESGAKSEIVSVSVFCGLITEEGREEGFPAPLSLLRGKVELCDLRFCLQPGIGVSHFFVFRRKPPDCHKNGV